MHGSFDGSIRSGNNLRLCWPFTFPDSIKWTPSQLARWVSIRSWIVDSASCTRPTLDHTWPRVFARNRVFYHGHRTSDDARNRVELWGVMIHVESSSKSNIHEKMTHMFDLAQDSTWIMTPHSSTLFLASSEVLWPLHKTMLRATTYPHVCSLLATQKASSSGRRGQASRDGNREVCLSHRLAGNYPAKNL